MDINKVLIFDTTLRDGEQSAGFRLGAVEKLEMARQLALLNVDIIEAGYPISSPEDFKAVALISENIEGPIIAALSRAVTVDIDECAKALVKAKKPRIHTGAGVSEAHILGKFKDEKYGKTLEAKKEYLLQMAVNAVKHAKKYVDDVQFYAEDAGRADWNYLFQVLEDVINAGATTVNIPDTTGFAVPEQYGDLIAAIKKNVPNINKAVISVHCHDDLGMAVSNSLAGVRNGAKQVECTINGIGERAGNAALEEVVMGLRTRPDYYGITTGINSRELVKTSQMVAKKFGFTVPVNKAVVGANAFAHSSGIHVDGVLKDRVTYEIMRPEDVGIKTNIIMLTARSGRHALQHRLEELGYHKTQEEIEQIYSRFLSEADKVQTVTDEMLHAIVNDEIRNVPERYSLEFLEVNGGTSKPAKATIKIKIGNVEGQEASAGDGPIDAIYTAINKITGLSPKLIDYNIRTTSAGGQALGEVSVKLMGKDVTVTGFGASTDITVASAKAYLDGLNKLIQKN